MECKPQIKQCNTNSKIKDVLSFDNLAELVLPSIFVMADKPGQFPLFHVSHAVFI